jgi:hypothetical protein
VTLSLSLPHLVAAESSAAKNNGSAGLWYALTAFAIALACLAAVLALLARRAGMDDRYKAWKRSLTGLLVMALLSFARAVSLR